MYASAIDFSGYGESLPYHGNENNLESPSEFWPEVYYDRLDESAHASRVAVLPSPVATDPAMSCTMPRPSCVDPQCFSPTTTVDTTRTTVDGENSGSDETNGTAWHQKRRKSSTAFKRAAREERASNVHQPRPRNHTWSFFDTWSLTDRTMQTHQGPSRRKSLSEPVKRERNRTAAAKCRAKSKGAEEDLKETQRIERERNLQLRATVEELSNESLMLKHELLSHSNCDHPIINNYLSRTADQISRGYSG